MRREVSASRMDDMTGNRLVDALPVDELRALGPALEEVSVAVKGLIYEQGEPITHVHFPVTAVISLVAVLGGGESVELATVGNEGMVGVPAFLQAGSTNRHVAVRASPGGSRCLGGEAFRDAAEGGRALHDYLPRVTQSLLWQIVRG